jgi:glycosyltransferase involved in cell wall biosynthesis
MLGITDRVEFMGERSDIPALLAEADIFVLSSNWEAFPISVLEAMRAGLPIVVSDVGGSAEAVIEGETGFVVPRQDDGMMATALSILLKDPALHKRLGANARELFFNRFTLDPMIDRTLDVYLATRARTR